MFGICAGIMLLPCSDAVNPIIPPPLEMRHLPVGQIQLSVAEGLSVGPAQRPVHDLARDLAAGEVLAHDHRANVTCMRCTILGYNLANFGSGPPILHR